MGTYEVTVTTHFMAVHAVAMPDGSMEPPHQHDWQVEAAFRADRLNRDGFVIDFLAVSAALANLAAELGGKDLNAVLPAPASAERVCQYLAERLRQALGQWPFRVRVTEAPLCGAAYYPNGGQ
jgi:6-pyruvoyltetrahydropterin/6-carboxytetrahydropterin synthase